MSRELFLRMPMSVVRIRYMCVGMALCLMPMHMAVIGIQTDRAVKFMSVFKFISVFMVMMSIIVRMPMIVFDAVVPVFVRVVFADNQNRTQHHDSQGDEEGR